MSTGSGAAPTSTSSTLSRTRVTKRSAKRSPGSSTSSRRSARSSRHATHTRPGRSGSSNASTSTQPTQRSSRSSPGTPRDGLISYVLGTADLVPEIPASCETDKPIVCAFVPGSEELHQRAIDTAAHLAALQAFQGSDEDWVARRELNERTAAARRSLDEKLGETLASSESSWALWNGTQFEPLDSTGRPATAIASLVADRVYSRTPTIASEMLNRFELTSQGAKARRAADRRST